MFLGEDRRYLRLIIYLNAFYCVASALFGRLDIMLAFVFSGVLGIVYFVLLRQRIAGALGMTKKKAMLHMHWGLVLRIIMIVLAFLLFVKMGADKLWVFVLGLLSYQTVLFVEMIWRVLKNKFSKEGG